MPETIILEDGTEREVPTSEELDAFKASGEEALKLKIDLEANNKTIEDLKANQDPNYKKLREALVYKDTIINNLKEEGKTLDENGKIVDAEQKVDANDIIKQATESSKKAVIDSLIAEKKNKLLEKYDDDQKGMINHYFDKLTAGEEVSLDKVENIFNQAAGVALPPEDIKTPNVNGNAPSFNTTNKKNDFAESDEGQAVLKEIWGDKAYTNKK